MALSPIGRLRRRQIQGRQDLQRRVHDAQVELGKKVQKAAKAKDLAKPAYQSRFFKRVRNHYATLGRDLDIWARELTGETAVDWHKAALTDIRKTGGKIGAQVVRFDRSRVKRYFEMIHPESIAGLAGTATERPSVADVFIKGMGRQEIANLRQATIDIGRQSSLEGWSSNEFQKKLQAKWNELSGNLVDDRFIDSRGRRWKNAHYLSTLTRTLTARVARDSYFDTLENNGDDLVRVTPSGDSCAICRAWIGVIISISGAPASFPSYSDALAAGLFHPNCDCLTRRIDPVLDEADIDRQAKTSNVDWNDRDAVGDYKGTFTETPIEDVTATLEDVMNAARGPVALRRARRGKAAAKPEPGTVAPTGPARASADDTMKKVRQAEADAKSEVDRLAKNEKRLEREVNDVWEELKAIESSKPYRDLGDEVDRLYKENAPGMLTRAEWNDPTRNAWRLRAEELRIEQKTMRGPAGDRLQEAADRLVAARKASHDVWRETNDRIRDDILLKDTAATPAVDWQGTVWKGARRKKTEDGIDIFNRLVGAGSVDGRTVTVKPYRGKRSRAYGNTINMSKSAGPRTTVHELGHWLEEQVPEVHTAALSFLQKRAGSDATESLKKLTGMGYKRNERAWKDKFIDPYMGKQYAGGRYTEIVSMGLEYLSHDPIALVAKDPEMFRFVWTLLGNL